MANMINALTVDVEDYFHVSAFREYVDRKAWPLYPLRVEENTRSIIRLFDEHLVKGTFFVLGWVAERCKGLVKEIHAHGHEVACHGYGHQLIYAIGPKAFREDIRKAKQLLEDICGESVRGYRAPSFSITNETVWALDILIEEGFSYDSSIFPIHHDLYGMREAEPHPHVIERSGGVITEFPLSTLPVRMLNREIARLPISGGGYARFFPLWFLKSAMRHVNTTLRRPIVFYFHPWEIDPGQPRIKAGMKSRFRHYHNLHRTEGKVRDLLSSFQFAPMREVLEMPHAVRRRADGQSAG